MLPLHRSIEIVYFLITQTTDGKAVELIFVFTRHPGVRVRDIARVRVASITLGSTPIVGPFTETGVTATVVAGSQSSKTGRV
jgi:hypothetical protein